MPGVFGAQLYGLSKHRRFNPVLIKFFERITWPAVYKGCLSEVVHRDNIRLEIQKWVVMHRKVDQIRLELVQEERQAKLLAKGVGREVGEVTGEIAGAWLPPVDASIIEQNHVGVLVIDVLQVVNQPLDIAAGTGVHVSGVDNNFHWIL